MGVVSKKNKGRLDKVTVTNALFSAFQEGCGEDDVYSERCLEC